MKYRVNLPIVDLTEFEVIVEAESENAALEIAEFFYDTTPYENIEPGTTVKLNDGSEVKFVDFKRANSWTGTEVEIEPVEADASAETA